MPRTLRQRFPQAAGLAAGLLLLAAATGCGPGGPLVWNLSPRVKRPDPAVVIFIVDGLPPRFVEQGCAEGWLPNIKARFHDAGLHVQNAVASLPCVTYGSIHTMLTGVEPAVHGIIGNRWFDPPRALFRHYNTIAGYRLINTDSDLTTLYQRIAPEPSASIQTADVRGVTCDVANWATSGVMWCFGDYTAVDKLTASSTTAVARWASIHKQWPTVVTYYLPGADTVGHRHGVNSPAFRQAIQHADYQIGRVCDWLEAQGILDTTTLVLLSDHGHVAVHNGDGFIDLLTLLRDGWGRNVTKRMLQDGSLRSRRAFYDKFDTVLNDQDGRRVSIHFKSAQGWQTPPAPQEVEAILMAPDEADRLWNIPGVQCVAYLEDANTAALRNGKGYARVRETPGPDGPRYAYCVETGDVLGYRSTDSADSPAHARLRAAIDARQPLSDRDWLELTADATYPDVVSRIIPLLRNRRAGQVVAFAERDYSFVREDGGHGGLHRNEALMTWLMAGPGIRPGTNVFAARGIDILPTLLYVLHKPEQAADLPGRPLAEVVGADRAQAASITAP